MKENKYLKQAKEELAYLSNDPDFQLLVESRAGMLRDIECMKSASVKYGYEEGKTQGFAAGRTEGRAEGLAEGEHYNIPIDVDTIEKGYPILCA